MQTRLIRPQRPRHSGMTLVEILAVVIILSLVTGTLMLGFGGASQTARREVAKSAIGIIDKQLQVYESVEGSLPSNSEGLAMLTDGSASPTSAFYLRPDQLIDPWGNDYIFIAPGPNGHPYEIVCYGSDGVDGGEDDAADISSLDLRDLN